MMILSKLVKCFNFLMRPLSASLTYFAGTCSRSVTSPSSPNSPKSSGFTDFCRTRPSPRLQQNNAASRRQIFQLSSSRLPNRAAYNPSIYPLRETGDMSSFQLYIEFNLPFRLISNYTILSSLE